MNRIEENETTEKHKMTKNVAENCKWLYYLCLLFVTFFRASNSEKKRP